MADLNPNAQEDKDVEPGSDSSGPTKDPVHSHTFSLKNNAAGLSEQLSSDTHQNPLNGAQPKPFVYRSIPAVPHVGNSLPSGALVNGPGSHSTSEERCVLNKDSILPNNVLDTHQQPEKDIGPQVFLPPIELQSDAGKNTAGPILPTLPGANPALSDTEDSEDELPYTALPGHSPDQVHVRQILMNKGIRARSIWESSENSSDDFDNDADINWEPQKELIRFLWNGHSVSRSLEEQARGIRYVSQRQRKHKVHMPEPTDKVYNGCIEANEDTHIDDDGDDDGDNDRDDDNDDDNYDSVATRVSEDVCNQDNLTQHVDNLVITKPKQLKTEEHSESEHSETETPFFSRTKRSVTSKERIHLHRHMIYHLDGHNQVHRENVPQPFICRECGRSFRAHNSLLKHMTIHQQRREKLMEEIKGLSKPPDEGRNARLQCPQCMFGTNCLNTFVQHGKNHKRDKRYFRCEECNHVSLTERELEAHLQKVHFSTRQPKYMTVIKDKEETSPLFHCNVCSFSTQNENVLKRHSELIHQRLSDDEYESPQFNKVSVHTESMCSHKLTDMPKKANIKPLELKPKLCIKTPAFRKRADLPYWSSNKANFYMSNTDRQKSYKGLHSSQLKCSLGSTTNKMSQSLQWSDKPSKLPRRPMEKIDVTTGLPYVEEENHEYDKILSENSERTKYPSNIEVLLTTKAGKSDARGQMFCHGYDSSHSQGGSDLTGRKVKAALQKSPSKRKMSTPLRNTIDRMVDNVLPKLHQRLKGYTAPDDTEGDDEDTYDFSDYTSEATANFLDSSENEKNPYARSYFIRRQRALVKEGCVPAGHHYNTEDANSSDIQQLIIKEEGFESAVCDESPTDSQSDPALPVLGTEQKSCPYCPAIFESGVGLSNHVRGHLYRVGLSYDARHMISPEQVASQDRQPRIRRKIPSVVRRVKKADKPELQGEHTCPLCWGWFDTKTGLSNHVRGHLKRIGKTITSTSKSPLCILNELLQDEKEHQHILQLLGRKQVPSRPFVSQKFIGSDGLFLMPMGLPVKIQHGTQANTPWRPGSSRQEGEDLPEKKRTEIETQEVTEASSSTLVELLKRRKDKELEARDSARKHFTVTKERMEGIEAMRLEPHWVFEGSESNKKICIHCNTIFPSAVSLSNHLRAYARRKRVAMLEGTSYDCKQKKPRSRPGLKKKVFPLSNAMEKIYRLTCRFCDLVFQGPLSVQEDWIKHLQRHLMHTSVPHTGTGMVEVHSLHQETPPMSHEEPGLEQHLPPLELPVVS